VGGAVFEMMEKECICVMAQAWVLVQELLHRSLSFLASWISQLHLAYFVAGKISMLAEMTLFRKPFTAPRSTSASSRNDSDTVFEYQDDASDRREERRIIRKVDFTLLPILCWLFVLIFLDRINIGNAKIAGMEKELGCRHQPPFW
jgi:hypothetical protein